MILLRSLSMVLAGFSLLAAQDTAVAPAGSAPATEAQAPAQFPIETGTIVPLSLINTISTKHSQPGDRVYLETAFPVLSNGRIVIPVGSHVAGTVTQIKKPGRVKGRAQMYVRFDSLILPNGVTRDFRGRMGGMDGNAPGNLDRVEGKVTADGNRMGDVRTVAETTANGAGVGGIIGSASGHPGMGVGVGAAAGAAAGLIAILVSPGPDAVLPRGTTVEMVLDRPISFNEKELNFGNYQPPRFTPDAGPRSDPSSSMPPYMRRNPK